MITETAKQLLMKIRKVIPKHMRGSLNILVRENGNDIRFEDFLKWYAKRGFDIAPVQAWSMFLKKQQLKLNIPEEKPVMMHVDLAPTEEPAQAVENKE